MYLHACVVLTCLGMHYLHVLWSHLKLLDPINIDVFVCVKEIHSSLGYKKWSFSKNSHTVIFNPIYTLDDESNMPANLPGDLGAQFTEIFTKKHENVSLLLSLLEVCLLFILKFFLPWKNNEKIINCNKLIEPPDSIHCTNRNSILQEYDFHVRWPTVKLLTILLTNKGKDLQEAILVSPMGVSKLMDLLSDSREIIRNDVGIFCQKL